MMRILFSTIGYRLLMMVFLPWMAIITVSGNDGQVSVAVQEQGGVIPYADISLTSNNGQNTYQKKTDSKGEALFQGLPHGQYEMKVSYLGFSDHIVTISVDGSPQNKDVMMILSVFSESISVVTANRKEELLQDIAEPTILIDAAALLDSGATSAEDALMELSGSGLEIQSSGGMAHVSLNGISNNGILVLVDGRRYLGKNGFGDLDLADLNLSNIDRIEVVKGAGSAIYGSEAMGGVVNFITKKAGISSMTNDFNMKAGTYNDGYMANTVAFRKGDFNGTFSASFRTYDGYDLNEESDETVGDPKSEDQNLSTNLEKKLNDRITMGGLFSYSRREIKENWTGGTSPFNPLKNNLQERTQIIFSPEMDIILNDSVLHIRYNYSKFERLDTDIYKGSDPVKIPPWTEWNNELNLTYKRPYSAFGQNQFLQAGYEFRNEKMDRTGIEIPETGASEAQRDIQVLWLSNELNFGDRVKTSMGFRYDDFSDFGNEFSPKFSVIFKANDQNRLRGSYGHGFLAPRFGQLYYPLTDFGIALLRGNPDLMPETSDSISLGYSYSSKRYQASLDVFSTDIENGIGFDFSGDPWTYKNFNRYKSEGFNFEMAVNLPHGFTPSLSYTHKTAEGSDGEDVPGVVKNAYFAKLVWSNPRLGIRSNLRATYQDETTFSDRILPEYGMVHFLFNKRLKTFGNHTIHGFFQVKNLLDEKDVFYKDLNGTPIPNDFGVWQPPRTFYVGFKLSSNLGK